MTLRESVSASHTILGGFLYETRTATAFLSPLDGRTYSIQNIVDRIGTGDAFTGALLYALTTPGLASPKSAVEFATAAACLAHSIEGDQNFTTRTEIEALMQGDASGRVQRWISQCLQFRPRRHQPSLVQFETQSITPQPQPRNRSPT